LRSWFLDIPLESPKKIGISDLVVIIERRGDEPLKIFLVRLLVDQPVFVEVRWVFRSLAYLENTLLSNDVPSNNPDNINYVKTSFLNYLHIFPINANLLGDAFSL
jgi:hypothetical protein